MTGKNSKARIEANTRYNKKAYDNLSVRVPKNLDIGELLSKASDKTGKSKAKYIIDAILAQLGKDGIIVESRQVRAVDQEKSSIIGDDNVAAFDDQFKPTDDDDILPF